VKRAPRIAVIVCSCLLLVSSGAAGRPESSPPNQAKLTKQLEAGKKALRDGKYENAIRTFAKADRLSGGGSTTAYLGLATAHLQLSHFGEAMLQADKALAVATLPYEQAVAYNLLGTALWRTCQVIPYGQKDDREPTLTRAESALRNALDLTVGDMAIAWSNLALVLEQQGSLAEAEGALQEYLERAPGNTSAEARLAQIQVRLAWKAQTTQAIENGKLFKVTDSGNVLPPQKISTPPPQYTEMDREARIQGIVILGAIIDEEGYVTDATILKGVSEGLNEAALRAVWKWKFEPATKNGLPVAVIYNLTVNFSLQ